MSLPSWIQQTYPTVPDGASSITLRFEMDGRYRPQLYGGDVPERLADLQLLALYDWRVGLQESHIAPILTTPLTNSKPVP